ncbi:MAG: leucyl aminopeptidase [Acetobacterales bacterium]
MLNVSFAKQSLPRSGVLVVAVCQGKALSPKCKELDKATGGALKRAIDASGFDGDKSKVCTLLAPPGLDVSRVVLIGLGEDKKVDDLAAEDAGGHAVAALSGAGEETASIWFDLGRNVPLGEDAAAAEFAFGAQLRSYRFDKYRTREEKKDRPTLRKVAVMVEQPARARNLHMPLGKVAEGIFLTRDLVSEPPNILFPESFVKECRKLARLGIRIEVLDKRQMKKLGMGTLLGVAQGSARDPYMVVMQWNGAKAATAKPVAFVGKGVTFDTGGISIKPAGGMEDMKWDMGGAGVVTGLMKALAGRKAKANVVGVIGLVENMVSGTAQRPGDVVTSMSGQTVEVINTDAEGRLVLADALWYTQGRFKPQFMVNLATLTGAVIVALGEENAGLFSNNDELATRLEAAGRATGDHVWRLPLAKAYDDMLKSDIADMKNIGGRSAGSITAAQFLQRFVNEVPWAHLDIAGVTWSKKAKPTVPRGGTGFGVRLLDRLVRDHYEK